MARPGRKIFYALLAAGSWLLLRSLMLQLFWPLAALDGPAPQKHAAFCVSQLLLLRRELEEATWQDMARGLNAPKGFCANNGRMDDWQARIGVVHQRCEAEPKFAALAVRLRHLATDTCKLYEGAEALWQGEGRSLQEALRRLAG